MPQLGCINVHGSILPKYRERPDSVVSLSRRNETGINDVNGCGDGYGGNLLKAFTPIHLLDNAQDLAQRLAQLGQIYW